MTEDPPEKKPLRTRLKARIMGMSRKEVSFYYNGMSIGVTIIALGTSLWIYKIPRTVDEGIAWLPGVLLFLGIIGLSRRLIRPYKKDQEPDTPTEEEIVDVDPPKSDRVFPVTGKSILKMCWGMTLNLSHEPQERELGKAFTDRFLEIFAEWEKKKKNPSHQMFIHNLMFVLSGTLRNIAFVRENHVLYLDYQADRLTRRRRNLEQVADPASFSGSGLYSKVGSFVGFGSIGAASQVAQSPDVSTHLPGYIQWFGALGLAGVIGVTLLARAYVSWTDPSWVNDLMDVQNEYWRLKFKRDVVNQLFYVLRHVRRLIKQCYGDKASEILQHDNFLQMKDEAMVRRIIKDEILPPDCLDWPPYIVAEVKKPQSADETKSAPAKDKGGPQGAKDKAQSKGVS
jgi:hypothetical protein